MSQPVISVEGLSKQYRIGAPGAQYGTLADTLSQSMRTGLGRLRGKQAPSATSFWALRDVSFTVQPGEVVGIIGRNGAGKSTLLKVLSRITEPTSGRVRIRGRMASLLEVGTGFHAELSGRENVFLNGAILGMHRHEIARKFDEIVSFAEVEQFIDTPVKRYSSGMYLRLAFAVAAHLEPEILVVDEVLAVGDAAFQKRCLGKMQDVARQGRTVLFVSHNMQAIATLTQSCVFLANGAIQFRGVTANAIAEYLRSGETEDLAFHASREVSKPTITHVSVNTSDAANLHQQGHPFQVAIEITSPYPIEGARLSVHAVNALQQPTLEVWAYDCERPWCRQSGTLRLVCNIPKLRLAPGQYHLHLRFAEPYGGRLLHELEGVCPFEVTVFDRPRAGGWGSGKAAYFEDCSWSHSQVAAVLNSTNAPLRKDRNSSSLPL
ncbi:MAG: polysaccharide ABC transporter ATP-binding protein [Actinomycetota bacterium]